MDTMQTVDLLATRLSIASDTSVVTLCGLRLTTCMRVMHTGRHD